MKGPIAQGALRTSAALALRMVVQAGTLLLVARWLGPDRFGVFAGAASLAVMMGTLSTFGTHTVLLGAIAREPGRRNEVLTYSLPLTLLCGGLLLGAYLLICRLWLGQEATSWRLLVPLGVTELLLQPLFLLPVSEHLGLGRVARSQLLANLPLLLRLVGVLGLQAWPQADPMAALAQIYLGASLLAGVLALRTLDQPLPRRSSWRWPHRSQLAEAAGFAMLAVTASGPVELDKALATRLLPDSAAGLYIAGARVIGAGTLPVIALTIAALPRLFREGRSHPARTARLERWIFVAVLAYSLCLALLLWWAAPWLAALFGSAYEGLDGVIRSLCWSVPGLALRITVGSMLMAADRPWMRAGFELVGLLILGGAALVLTGRFGSTGMPLALACSEWGMAILGIYFVHRTRRGV